ncbi:ABC transporter permease [Vibrio nigripulchritudo]|uniref:ABC transporter permease n=1 Tax=Vibrio nigripulchritudo TaxID=28173 RepID=UPI0005F9ACFC|nr:ABC transporter permease [Vibrio nigripulchritudo]KJY68546.1 ABC transporter permease [Vibrio nigripulchritudo]
MLDGRNQIQQKTSLRLWLSASWLVVLILAALFAPFLSPFDPLEQDLFTSQLPPSWLPGGEEGYWLGSDSLGRDVLSRILYGARVSLTIALVAGLLTCVIGSLLGLIAGYYRGWADSLISRITDIWMAFPPVLFAILLIAVIGTGLSSVIIAIVVIDWTRFTRVVRAETLNQCSMDYVVSAQVVARPKFNTLLLEVFPNVLPAISVLLTLEMGIAVIVEAILSFVNLSLSSDFPTWGSMISEGRGAIHQTWWVLVFPLVVLFLTLLSFSQLGEGLKERFDPVLK